MIADELWRPEDIATPTHLYRHFDKDDKLLYVGISKNTINRLGQHENNSHWFGLITRITIERFPDRKTALEAERVSISKENPLFNLQRPFLIEMPSHAEESKKDLVKRIVQFNAVYSINDAADTLALPRKKLKEMAKNNEIGHIVRQTNPKKNKFGNITCYPKYFISGWQLIEYIESVSVDKMEGV